MLPYRYIITNINTAKLHTHSFLPRDIVAQEIMASLVRQLHSLALHKYNDRTIETILVLRTAISILTGYMNRFVNASTGRKIGQRPASV